MKNALPWKNHAFTVTLALICLASILTLTPPPRRARGQEQTADPQTREENDKGSIAITDVDPDGTIYDGDTVTVTATVRDKDGNPKGGVPVTFVRVHRRDDGTTAQETTYDTTANNGEAETSWNSDKDDVGSNTVTASANPQDDYSPAQDSESPDVKLDSVSLSAENDKVTVGNPAKLTATVDSGKPNKAITITSYSRNSSDDPWQLINSPAWTHAGNTDQEGKVKFTTPSLVATHYRFVAYHDANHDGDGSDLDNPDQGEVAKERVDGDFTLKSIVLHGYDAMRNLKEGEDRFIYRGSAGFRAEIDPDNSDVRQLKYQFKWTLDEVDNPGPKPDWGDHQNHMPKNKYASRIGSQSPKFYIKFKLTILPEDNSGFGSHELTTDVVGWQKTKSTETRLFYYRGNSTGGIGYSHPHQGNIPTPNWYYYWSKEGAAQGQKSVCVYSRDSNNSDYAEWKPDDPNHSGNVFGSQNNGKITLYNDIVEVPKDQRWTKGQNEHASSYHFPEPGGDLPPNVITFSINETSTSDFANITFAHEQTHKKLQNNTDEDTDQDGVPDKFEKKVMGMDVHSKKSFPNSFYISQAGTFADQEFYCVLGGTFIFGDVNGMSKSDYMGVFPEDAHEENDWSVYGPNWEKSDDNETN